MIFPGPSAWILSRAGEYVGAMPGSTAQTGRWRSALRDPLVDGEVVQAAFRRCTKAGVNE